MGNWNVGDLSTCEGVCMNIEGERAYILTTARELYGRVVYSHKTHEQEREFWGAKTLWMNRANISLTGLTTLLAIIFCITTFHLGSRGYRNLRCRNRCLCRMAE